MTDRNDARPDLYAMEDVDIMYELFQSLYITLHNRLLIRESSLVSS